MKVGDKVKIVKSVYENESLQPGCNGVIVSIDATWYDIVVEGISDDWPFAESELEVIA